MSEPKPGTIIIGAGATGLMAAHVLCEMKIDVLVLEARSRIGGRIHSFQPEGFSKPIEEGAEFIHGKRELTLQLVKQAGLNPVKATGSSWSYENGQLKNQEDFITDWDKLLSKLKELKTDVPIKDFLELNFPDEKDKALRHSVTSFVEGYDAADINYASSFALRREWTDDQGEEQFRFSEGYHSLVNYLQQSIEKKGNRILKDETVTSIDWSGREVIVKGRTNAWTCNKAIITVPLGVLQSGDIKFTPELPFANYFNKIGFGDVTKIMIEFSRPFWKEAGRSLKDLMFVFSDEAVPTWWTQSPDERPLLTGWIAGKNRSRIACRSPDEILSISLGSLETIFSIPGGSLRRIVSGWHYKDWKEDPFSKGAYAYATIETAAALLQLKKPVENKLFFAGEAFYEGPAMGTVEAALVSGRDVAMRI